MREGGRGDRHPHRNRSHCSERRVSAERGANPAPQAVRQAGPPRAEPPQAEPPQVEPQQVEPQRKAPVRSAATGVADRYNGCAGPPPAAGGGSTSCTTYDCSSTGTSPESRCGSDPTPDDTSVPGRLSVPRSPCSHRLRRDTVRSTGSTDIRQRRGPIAARAIEFRRDRPIGVAGERTIRPKGFFSVPALWPLAAWIAPIGKRAGVRNSVQLQLAMARMRTRGEPRGPLPVLVGRRKRPTVPYDQRQADDEQHQALHLYRWYRSCGERDFAVCGGWTGNQHEFSGAADISRVPHFCELPLRERRSPVPQQVPETVDDPREVRLGTGGARRGARVCGCGTTADD